MLGRHQQLIHELEVLVAEHPYRERLHAQLMLALYRSGRQVEALRAYQQARRTLTDELGLEPSQELTQLERAILRQDATLTLEMPAKLEAQPRLPLAPAAAATPPRNLAVQRAEVRYARSGDVNVAYQVVGDGPRDLVLVSASSRIYNSTAKAALGVLLERLASFSRLIRFDKRGTGLSTDPVVSRTRNADGRCARGDGRGRQRAGGPFGFFGGRADVGAFAATYPSRTTALRRTYARNDVTLTTTIRGRRPGRSDSDLRRSRAVVGLGGGPEADDAFG